MTSLTFIRIGGHATIGRAADAFCRGIQANSATARFFAEENMEALAERVRVFFLFACAELNRQATAHLTGVYRDFIARGIGAAQLGAFARQMEEALREARVPSLLIEDIAGLARRAREQAFEESARGCRGTLPERPAPRRRFARARALARSLARTFCTEAPRPARAV